MGLVSRVKAAYRALTIDQFQSLGLLAPPTVSGVSVTDRTAFTVAAFYNGIDVISGDIGVLDRIPYERGEGDERRRLPAGHYLYKLMRSPNPYMTPLVFWQTLSAHALATGNGYAEIEWDKALRPIGLWPIPPDMMEPVTDTVVDSRGRQSTKLWYRYAGRKRLDPEDILHIPGLGYDGIRGYSVVAMARESLGLSMAVEKFFASYFGNGTWPGLALEHSGNLSREAQARLRESLEMMHRGADKAHKLLILEEGMKASKPLTAKPEDAQLAEMKDRLIEDVARWLNLPPHKLKHRMGERPGGNFEASQIEYQTGTLLRWTTRIEQELERKLLPASAQGRIYIEHLFEKLLRVDVKTRTEAEKAWVDMGAITPAYVAKVENFPAPEERPESLSMAEKVDALGQLIRAGFEPAAALEALGLPKIAHTGQPPTEDVPPSPAPAPRAVRAPAAHRALVAAVVGHYVRRECARVQQQAKRGAEGFGAWVEDFYRRDVGVLAECIEPAVMAALDAAGGAPAPMVRALAQRLAAGYVARSSEALLALPAKDLAFAAEKLAKAWETKRATELTDEIMALQEQEAEHVA